MKTKHVKVIPKEGKFTIKNAKKTLTVPLQALDRVISDDFGNLFLDIEDEEISFYVGTNEETQRMQQYIKTLVH